MQKFYLRKKDLELARHQLEAPQLQDPYSSISGFLSAMSLINRLEQSFQNQTNESEIQQIQLE